MIKLMHLITGLTAGGAQTMLQRLLSRMDRQAFKSEVVSLMEKGPTGTKIQALGVPVRALGMRRGVPNPLGVLRLARWLRQSPPDVIQTWMYHADLVGSLAGKLAGGIPVVWGIRHANLDPQWNKRSTLWTAKACAHLSHYLPERIVCCSEASRRVHQALGYATDRMVVIPNGFDLDTFVPDPEARRSVRQELGLSEEVPVIGLAGRFHPLKDFHSFVWAAGLLHAQVPEVHFFICGEGVSLDNPELAGWISEAGIGERCHLLGPREDMPRFYAALDIAVSSSYGEGFPNAIGEAMACGVPCVVTEVGDSGWIVAHTGRVLPPRSPQALAQACRELIGLGPEGRRRLGLEARRRIQEHFSLSKIVPRYEALYRAIAKRSQP